MAFDDSLIKDILAHVDIVDVISSYLNVTKAGKQYVAICPFHNDTTPSLQISREKQIFNCFVCHTGGNAISFVSKYEHISFFEAMQKVAKLGGYSDPRLERKQKDVKVVADPNAPLKKCLEDLTTYYEYALNTDEGEIAYKYLSDRHLDDRLIQKYRIGYAFKDGAKTCSYLEGKGHSLKVIELSGVSNETDSTHLDRNAGRVIFPIMNINGDVIGYSARTLSNDKNVAKYKNSKDTPLFNKSTVLYNINNAAEEARHKQYIYVLEGFMDVIALDRIGEYSAVAVMGTALTDEHIKILRSLNCEIRLCLDGDNAGQENMMRVMDKLSKSGLNFCFVDSKGCLKDADEILNEDGEEALSSYLKNLVSPFDFAMNYYKMTKPLTKMEDRKKLISYFLPFVSKIDSELERSDYILKLSQVTKFDVNSINALVKKARQKDDKTEYKEMIYHFRPEIKALKKLSLAEKSMLYLMLNDKEAISFFEDEIEHFYDDIYQYIANYIVEYMIDNESLDLANLISFMESRDLENEEKRNAAIEELIEISSLKNHISCSKEYLNELLNVIQSERKRIYEKETLERLLEGKSEIEKARILADYNRRRAMKLEEESNDGKKD